MYVIKSYTLYQYSKIKPWNCSVCVAIVEVGSEHAYVYQERPATYDSLRKSESQTFQASIKDTVYAQWNG